MKAADTNVLARYFLGDDPDQTRRAAKFLNEECSVAEPCLINRIVLCELVWVLERGYKQGRERIVAFLEELFQAQQIVIEDSDEALLALRKYENGAGFADSFLGELNRRLGCEYTATFDRRAARGLLFRRL